MTTRDTDVPPSASDEHGVPTRRPPGSARSATGRLGVHRADPRGDPRQQRAEVRDQGRPPRPDPALPARRPVSTRRGASSRRIRPARRTTSSARVERADGTVGLLPAGGRRRARRVLGLPLAQVRRAAMEEAARPSRSASPSPAGSPTRTEPSGHVPVRVTLMRSARPNLPPGQPGPDDGPVARHPVLHDTGGPAMTAAVDPVARRLAPLLVRPAVDGAGRGPPHRVRARRDGLDVLARPVLDPFFGRGGAIPVRELAIRRLDALHPGAGLATDLGAVVGGRARRGRPHRRLPHAPGGPGRLRRGRCR